MASHRNLSYTNKFITILRTSSSAILVCFVFIVCFCLLLCFGIFILLVFDHANVSSVFVLCYLVIVLQLLQLFLQPTCFSNHYPGTFFCLQWIIFASSTWSSMYPLSIAAFIRGLRGAGAYLQQSLCERWGTWLWKKKSFKAAAVGVAHPVIRFRRQFIFHIWSGCFG